VRTEVTPPIPALAATRAHATHLIDEVFTDVAL
jgi:hypothetical protein